MNENVNSITTQVVKLNQKGELQNAYNPLQNLIDVNKKLGDFTSTNLLFDKNKPVDMLITDEYDGSSNIIINDDSSYPKLINNRFSIQENNTFLIPIHHGNKPTNIYDDSTFNKDSLLLKLYDNIPNLLFNGLFEGGSFKVGSYVFYFKLSDSAGNMTNIIQESGIVKMHIGKPNSKKIRMGLENENSFKSVKFTLSGIDTGFDYIRIFYERTSSSMSGALIPEYYMINLNYPIINGKCEITLTGKEATISIDLTELKTQFADILTAKTQTIVDNTLFLGNVSSYELNYLLLLLIAWRIIPSVKTIDVGSVNNINYSTNDSGAYYNSDNVYYHVGYWPDEFYRFGIVYIYDNNVLSPVFNIQGCDLGQIIEDKLDIKKLYFNRVETIDADDQQPIVSYSKRTTAPDDFFFDKKYFLNSKGVIRLPEEQLILCRSGESKCKALGIKFDFSEVCKIEKIYSFNTLTKEENTEKLVKYEDKAIVTDRYQLYTFLKSLGIKGFFFVRQKRIPSIIAQGMVVGLTDKDRGSIPVIKTNTGTYSTKSFLSESRLITDTGRTVFIGEGVTTKALLVPDYDINEMELNNIFTSLEFCLLPVQKSIVSNNGDSFYISDTHLTTNQNVVSNVKLTGVPKGSQLKTDGVNYFKSIVGSAQEPYKTEDVLHKWRYTKPQYLTTSTTLIRGEWGSYVGISTDQFDYGDIVNIRPSEFLDASYNILEFTKRFHDFSLYSAISSRQSISIFKSEVLNHNTVCFRGDCFCNVFTHRMMNNFTDPELPNNRKIVDPATWIKNYVVRCTAYELPEAIPNLASLPNGFYFPCTCKVSGISVLFALFAFLNGAFNAFRSLVVDPPAPYEHEICEGFEINIDDHWDGSTANEMANDPERFFSGGHIKALTPVRTETDPVGKAIKNIFLSDDSKWELHGIAEINRADINAVSFGLWITFPICSNYNLALRDIDFSLAIEETTTQEKRSFYPLVEKNIYSHLPESGTINNAAKVSLSSNSIPAFLTVPFIKQEYFNRIYWSKPNITETFINSYRMIFDSLYREYNKEFGSITKILPLANNLFVVFLHGMGMLQVTRAPQNEMELSSYLSSRSVLPPQIITISADYGSMWKDSILQTPQGVIYGIDTVARKIWQYIPGTGLKFISDHRLTKFLNEWIDLSEYDFNEYLGHINVKTHYNEFKHDVMFTYYKDVPLTKHHFVLNPQTNKFDVVWLCIKETDGDWNNDKTKWTWRVPTKEEIDNIIPIEVDLSGNLILEDTVDPKPLIDEWKPGKTWNLCFNEELLLFTTFYDWYPIESCNVDNIYFSFDKDQIEEVYKDEYVNPLQNVKDIFGNPLSSVNINKVFLDKAFTENTKVYLSSDNYISINTPNDCKYITVYYKGNNSPIIKKYES